MQELNLEVGQKVWTIQSSDSVVIEINDEEYCFLIHDSDGNRRSYDKFGRHDRSNKNPSLFESNPFEKKEEKSNRYKSMDDYYNSQSTLETVSQPENKAELINALYVVANAKDSTLFTSRKIAQDKLQKLLESL